MVLCVGGDIRDGSLLNPGVRRFYCREMHVFLSTTRVLVGYLNYHQTLLQQLSPLAVNPLAPPNTCINGTTEDRQSQVIALLEK